MTAEEQSWFPAWRRARLVLAALQLTVFSSLAMLWLTQGHGWLSGAFWVCAIAVGATQTADAWRRRVVADRAGVRVVGAFRTRRIAWSEVAELRPDARGTWATKLVAVRRDGHVLDVPVDPAHLDVLCRWWARSDAE